MAVDYLRWVVATWSLRRWVVLCTVLFGVFLAVVAVTAMGREDVPERLIVDGVTPDGQHVICERIEGEWQGCDWQETPRP